MQITAIHSANNNTITQIDFEGNEESMWIFEMQMTAIHLANNNTITQIDFGRYNERNRRPKRNICCAAKVVRER